MKYTRLGDTGLIVSQLGLGTMTFGSGEGKGVMSAVYTVDQGGADALVGAAIDAGVNHFNSGDVYCDGQSEEMLGRALGARRGQVVISTKVGIRQSPSQNDVGTGRKHLMVSIDEQLKRLQTDYIDVYQLHRLDPYTPVEETMYTLDQIVKSGKVRYIGGSTMPAYKFAQMIMLADWKGYARPIAMQNLYNLVQREEEREMNRLCEEQGVGLIPYSPLARGFLAGNRSKSR